MGPHRRRRPAPPPSASCCGCHCNRTWRSGVSYAAPYAVAWFWLKIASSGRGALAGTRWAHFNYHNKDAPRSNPRRSFHDKGRMKLAKKTNNLQISRSPRWGASEASATEAMSRSTSRSPAPRDAEPQVATEAPARSPSPPWGPVGSHVTKAERPPLERHDSLGVVLPDHLRQGDPGVPQMP
jgi:hypothetical protein